MGRIRVRILPVGGFGSVIGALGVVQRGWQGSADWQGAGGIAAGDGGPSSRGRCAGQPGAGWHWALGRRGGVAAGQGRRGWYYCQWFVGYRQCQWALLLPKAYGLGGPGGMSISWGKGGGCGKIVVDRNLTTAVGWYIVFASTNPTTQRPYVKTAQIGSCHNPPCANQWVGKLRTLIPAPFAHPIPRFAGEPGNG